MRTMNRIIQNRVSHQRGRAALRYSQRLWQVAFIILAMLGASFLSACGGSGGGGGATTGGGGTDVAALQLPNRISLTQADTSERDAAQGHLRAASFGARLYTDSGTDYDNLEKRVWVEDVAEVLDLVNEILETVKDTGYDMMVNQGPYVALVNTPGDDEGGQQGGSQGGAAASASESLSEMTVNVTRASNTAPMYVYFWLDEPPYDVGENAQRIKGRFEVREGVSAAFPMGDITAYIVGKDINEAGQEIGSDYRMKIGMEVGSNAEGEAVVEFVENHSRTDQGYEISEAAEMRVVADEDFNVGKARVYERSPDWDNFHTWGATPQYDEANLRVAFNENFIVADDDDDLYVFDKNAYTSNVYRYKLFDMDGNAVTLNSGFPIRFKESGKFGYVGYYGLWSHDNSEVASGTRVIREDNGVEYEVKQVAGKLIKHEQKTITLAQLTNVELSTWECTEASCFDVVFSWNGSDFRTLGVRSEATDWQLDSNGAGELVTFENEWEGAWCQSLQSFLPLGTLESPNDNTLLYYHAETTVVPGSDEFNAIAGDALALKFWDWELAQWTDYSWDKETLLLYQGDTVQSAAEINNGDTSYGELRPMVAADVQATIANDPHLVWEQEVFYSWRTGAEEWNKLTILQDLEGDYVPFDAPLQLSYEHAKAYDLNYFDGEAADPNEGRIFNFDYDGFELHLPWVFDEASGEWGPVVNLRDSGDSDLVLDGGDGEEYVLKGWEEELRMAQVEADDPDYDDIVGLAALDTEAESFDVAAPTIAEDLDEQVATIFADSEFWEKPTGVDVEVIKGELVE
ncbi:MAG: hypothetical protein QNJ22_16055 [Desulfosarcinaceae bacterium]|nr:hypothetical protein [Desulfosarcinaceae bacterium]